MRTLGLLAPLAPTTARPRVTLALMPERSLLEVLGRNDGAGLLAVARAIEATPESRWARVVFRAVDDGGRTSVTVEARAALASHFRESDLAHVAHEIAFRRVRPGSVLLLLESDAGVGVHAFSAGRFLRVVAKGRR